MKSECERDLDAAIEIAQAWEKVAKDMIIATALLLNEPVVQAGVSIHTKQELKKAVESAMAAARKGRDVAHIRLAERNQRDI